VASPIASFESRSAAGIPTIGLAYAAVPPRPPSDVSFPGTPWSPGGLRPAPPMVLLALFGSCALGGRPREMRRHAGLTTFRAATYNGR